MTENLPATAPLTGTIVAPAPQPATIPASVLLGAQLYAAIAAPPVGIPSNAERATYIGQQLTARLIAEIMSAFARGDDHVTLSQFSHGTMRAFAAMTDEEGFNLNLTNLAPYALRIHITPTEVNQSIDAWTGDKMWAQFKIGR